MSRANLEAVRAIRAYVDEHGSETERLVTALCLPSEGVHKVLPTVLIAAYICPAGYPTQGVGLLVRSLDVPAITPTEAARRYLVHLRGVIAQVLKLSPSLAGHPYRLAAIVDFVFNLGSGRYRSSTLRKRVDAGRHDDVPRELLRWIYGGGRVLPGLVARRKAEASLYLTNHRG